MNTISGNQALLLFGQEYPNGTRPASPDPDPPSFVIDPSVLSERPAVAAKLASTEPIDVIWTEVDGEDVPAGGSELQTSGRRMGGSGYLSLADNYSRTALGRRSEPKGAYVDVRA